MELVMNFPLLGVLDSTSREVVGLCAPWHNPEEMQEEGVLRENMIGRARSHTESLKL
jgi:hypothetical protein